MNWRSRFDVYAQGSHHGATTNAQEPEGENQGTVMLSKIQSLADYDV